MLKNYLKVAFRNIYRQRSYSFISILGLSIGLVCLFLILIYTNFESDYDSFLSESDRIYRIEQSYKGENWAASPRGVGPFVKASFPQITEMTRLQPVEGAYWVKNGDNIFSERKIFYADSTVLALFDFKLIKGSKSSILTDAFSVVLTESTARKYFGEEDPIGKTLNFEFDDEQSRTVVGIIKDIPAQSHFQFDFLCSIYSYSDRFNERWGNFNTYTYVKILSSTNLHSLKDKILLQYQEQYPDEKEAYEVSFMPVEDIHLHSHSEKEMATNNQAYYLRILILIGLLILLIAVINFIQLNISRYLKRNKEFGMRMTMGANKKQLACQLIIETFLITCISGVLAVLCIGFLLPELAAFTGLPLLATELLDVPLVGYFVMTITLVTGICGLLPIGLFSNKSISHILSNSIFSQRGKSLELILRRGLLVVQFMIATIFMIGSFIIYKQLNYLTNTQLGFQKEQSMVMPLNFERRFNAELLKNELLKMKEVQAVSFARSIPGYRIPIESFEIDATEKKYPLRFLQVGIDFEKTLDLTLKSGMAFDRGDAEKEIAQWILNEKAVALLFPGKDEQEVLGQRLGLEKFGIMGVVKGIVQDFHFESLHTDVGPLAMLPVNQFRFYEYAIVNFRGSAPNVALEKVMEVDHALFGHIPPIEPELIQRRISSLYAFEGNLQKLVSAFTLISIFLTIVSILSFISYLTLLKRKEIAIRRVFGSSILNLFALLLKDILVAALISIAISIPVGWLLVHRWLENFAYKVEVSFYTWIVCVGIILILAVSSAMVTVSKAASRNPALILRN